jgi:3D (Asp-Asp-Asp) domain-containing protein
MRKLKIASALAATTAALALGLAAPASADDVSIQAPVIAGFAYTSTDATGDGVTLLSGRSNCTLIGINARSAQNVTVATDESVIRLYNDLQCNGTPLAVLSAQQFALNLPAGSAAARAYTST